MKTFFRRFSNEVLIASGNLEDTLRGRGILSSAMPQFLLNLEKPDELLQLHKDCALAGADIITANTLGADRNSLKTYNLDSKIEAINCEAVKLAQSVPFEGIYISGHIGSLPESPDLTKNLTFDEIFDSYREQILILLNCGIHLIRIGPMKSMLETRAALIAANEIRKSVPVFVHCSSSIFEETNISDKSEAISTLFEGLSADVIGITMDTNSSHCAEITENLVSLSNLPVLTEYASDELSKDDLIASANQCVLKGASIIECSTPSAPDIIHSFSLAFKGQRVNRTKKHIPIRISSHSKAVYFGDGLPFVKIGERINPTGRRLLASALTENNREYLLKEAKRQVNKGAMALDINVALPSIDEKSAMAEVINYVQSEVDVPLVIDSASSEVLEAGLKVYNATALVNSVNGKRESIEKILPLVKRYGAAVILLAIGDKIPQNALERFTNAKNLISACMDYGISRNRIIVDPVVLTIATQQNVASVTADAIKLIKSELFTPTSVGLSNISFGMPNRSLINNTFLAQAIAAGLDAAIINPLDNKIHETIAASSIFSERDSGFKSFFDFVRSKRGKKEKQGHSS